MPFRAHVINQESEFTRPPPSMSMPMASWILFPGAGGMQHPIGNAINCARSNASARAFDDYSNLELDIDGDGDLDLISVNYRSKSIYWVRNPEH